MKRGSRDGAAADDHVGRLEEHPIRDARASQFDRVIEHRRDDPDEGGEQRDDLQPLGCLLGEIEG
jgi:hypothetical protein